MKLRDAGAGRLPAYHDGCHWRALGRIKTGRSKLAIAPFGTFLAEAGNPLLDLNAIGSFDRWQANVPILDQGKLGSCVAHGAAGAVMKARDLAGMTFQALSPSSLYAQIDGDVDMGSDPADAITALECNGICLLADVPDRFLLWSEISAEAKQAALRFRIATDEVYQCANFAELVTADYLGFATLLTITVGPNFNPGPDGVVGYWPGPANHCVSGGEALVELPGGALAYRFRNSWTSDWGFMGCGLCTAQHIDRQPGVELYAIKAARSDPLDPLNPP